MDTMVTSPCAVVGEDVTWPLTVGEEVECELGDGVVGECVVGAREVG